MIGEFFEWFKNTELYKDDKFFQLFLVALPTFFTFIGWIGNLIYKFFVNKHADKENRTLIKELEAKYEKQLKEKEMVINKLIETNTRYKTQLDIYKSSYGKLRVRR